MKNTSIVVLTALLGTLAWGCGSGGNATAPFLPGDGGLPDGAILPTLDGAVSTHKIGGTITGLSGAGLVLTDGAETLAVSAGGTFTFKTPLPGGAPYAVSVRTQPSSPTQTCTVSNGSGTVGSADVTNIAINCTTSAFKVGGSVMGLSGSGLVLENNNGDDLTVSADGTFSFATAVSSGNMFDVTVKTQPSSPSQTCVVTGASGTVGSADVASVAVNCTTDTFTVGGQISGLQGTVVLSDNGGDNLTVSANGDFAFPKALASGQTFAVTVATQPNSPVQVCSVNSGTGSVAGAPITSVRVQCSTTAYAVGGAVSGLSGTGLVLQDNAGDNLTVAAGGTFTFPSKVASGAGYAVTVLSQPSTPSQTCTVTSGTGTIASAAVTNVAVTCTTNAYTIGGTVTGLSGSGLVLEDNGADDLTVSANGTFSFPTTVLSGGAYAVTVKGQPSTPTQTCTVTGDTGTVIAGNVTSVTVNCSTNTYTVGGTIAGLAGTAVLQDNAGDNLTLNANGTFAFATPVASGQPYAVTVLTQPGVPSQTCAVSNGSGSVVSSNVTGVAITCTTNSYTVAGTVSGLAGTGLVLQDNGGDNLSVSANGTFTFAASVLSGAPYLVTVSAQPTGPSQTCVVTNGSATMGGANVSNVAVTCTTNTYNVGGTVTGLAGTGLVLQDNGGDNFNVTANGTFKFPTKVASGGAYAATVFKQPATPTQTCVVTTGGGTVGGSDVTTVAVTCTTNKYQVGGTVSGLAGKGLVLQDNAGDNLAVGASGAFSFATSIASGATYNVTVLTQPNSPTQTCTVTGGSGTVVAGNVTTVAVNCTTNTYTIGGTISGLAGTVVLKDNGGDNLTLNANGNFAFATPVSSGAMYAVTVGTQPGVPSQTCTVTTGSGTVVSANVTSVAVTCVTNRYTVGGTISGLAAGESVVLRDNGADNLTLGANGTFTFATSVPSGSAYAVTVLTNPTTPVAQTCVVTAGSGTMAAANVTNVVVTCTANKYSIGGTLTLVGAGTIVLQDNGGDNLTLSANGTFTFATTIASGATYAVTVLTPPAGQSCTLANQTGTVGAANVTNVAVACAPFVNPSFETGDYTGWTVWATQNTGTFGTWGIASNGQTIAAGASVFDYYTNQSIQEFSPGLPITYAATDGTKLALLLVNGPEEHRLYQNVIVPASATTLKWDMKYNNQNATFDPTNQYIAVNVRNPSTDAILATIYKTTQGTDPLVVSTMTTFSGAVTAYQGQPVRIDVDIMINDFYFDVSLDNFRFQ